MRATLLLVLVSVPMAASADESDVHYKSCIAYKQQGKTDEAIDECLKALGLRETAAAHFTIANLYRQKGLPVVTITHLEAAAKMAPKSAPIRANLGAAYFRANRMADAIRELELAVSLDPKDPDAQMNLGTAYRQQKMPDKALEHLRIATQLRPDAVTLNNLGVAQRQAGKLDDAMESFKKAIELKPDEADFHFNLATVLRRKNMAEAAIAQYLRAIELNESLAPAHYDLGILLEQRGVHDEAVQHFSRYLALTQGKDPKQDEEIRNKIKSLQASGPGENPPPAPKRKRR
jgi:tetratricopeptide (TPR) repeat protein